MSPMKAGLTCILAIQNILKANNPSITGGNNSLQIGSSRPLTFAASCFHITVYITRGELVNRNIVIMLILNTNKRFALSKFKSSTV